MLRICQVRFTLLALTSKQCTDQMNFPLQIDPLLSVVSGLIYSCSSFPSPQAQLPSNSFPLNLVSLPMTAHRHCLQLKWRSTAQSHGNANTVHCMFHNYLEVYNSSSLSPSRTSIGLNAVVYPELVSLA